MSDYVTVLVTTLSVFLAWWVVAASTRPRHPTARPWSTTVPVLGGSRPRVHAWSRFHVRYYPMALLFIVFEMEMMFMYPWAAVYVSEGVKALAEMGMFLTILAAGIAYAWREGALRWQ